MIPSLDMTDQSHLAMHMTAWKVRTLHFEYKFEIIRFEVILWLLRQE
jgi:hypothetical protein